MKRPFDLNDVQRQAVTSTAKRLLITAGPGTGKTHTLTARIAARAAELPEGRKNLALTFTNKAAREMQQRLTQMILDIGTRVFTGTFHQFCLTVLRKHATAAGLDDGFQIVTPAEIGRMAKGFWPDKKTREIKLILENISRLKTIDLDAVWPDSARRFSEWLRKQGKLDFDDLLRETLILLRAQPSLLGEWRSVYQDVFVDEYQDINPVQHELIKLLVGETGSVTAIGDPQQAIYGFRGAEADIFARFRKDFPGTVGMALSQNYRTSANLLSACSQVIAAADTLLVSELTATIYQQGRLIIQASPTDKAEAEFVVHQIEKLVGGVGMFSQDSGRVDAEDIGHYSFGDIAVLFRLNSQCRALKQAFDRLGIPYRASGHSKDSAEIVEDVYFDGIPEPEIDGERVSLLTLHAAKGLEFPVVFIVGCDEGLIPLKREGLESDSEEERRLFYVGMTRAKQRLYLISARKRFLYGQFYQSGPSPFLKDIDRELKETAAVVPKKDRKKKDQQMSLFR